MSCASIPAYDVQRANFHKKMKMMNLQYFNIFMYIWWLLKFLGVFLWKAYQTLSPYCPSGTQHHHWGLGIPGYTFGSSIQARAIPPPSWGSAPSVTTGSLSSLQWTSPPSTLQKRHSHSLFMIVFWEYGQKRCVIWRKLALCTSN